MSYRIDRRLRTLFTQTTAVLRDEDLRTLWRAIKRDPEMRPGLNELHDRTGVTACELSTAFVWEFAESFSEFDSDQRVNGAKVATVATKDALYGLAQMNATLRGQSPAEFRVFRDVSEARAWLGLPPEPDDSNLNWNTVCS
jgi:hypothetical protein